MHQAASLAQPGGRGAPAALVLPPAPWYTSSMAVHRRGSRLGRRFAPALLAALLSTGCGGLRAQAPQGGAREPAGQDDPGRDGAARRAPDRSRLVVPASARDQRALQAALDGPAVQEAAAGCGEGQRRLGALPPGSLTLRLTIEPGGEVSSAELAPDTPPPYRGSYLAACLAREARAFPFPPSGSPSAVSFEIEFPVE